MIWSIRDRRAFRELARSRCTSRTKALWCRYVSDPKARPLRVAFAVGRSYGHAVERNRWRRRMRVIVDRIAAETGLTSGWLLVGAQHRHADKNEHTFDALAGEAALLLRRLPCRTSVR